MTECSSGLAYSSTSTINLWTGYYDGNYSGNPITNSGYTSLNYNSGGAANAMSSIKNYCNRFVCLYKNQNGWNDNTSNGTFTNALIVMPSSSIPYFSSSWNDSVNSANVDSDPVTADHFMQVVGNDINIGGSYQTNFYGSMGISDAEKVSLTQSISNNLCSNGYASQGGTSNLYDALVLGASLYGHETAWQALVGTGAGSFGPSGTGGISPSVTCYQNLTDLSLSSNNWLKTIVQDSNGNLNAVGCNAIQTYANTGANLNNAVCLAILNDSGSYGTSYSNGNALLSSNYTSYCTGTNLTLPGCEQFCGKTNAACQNAVINFCQGTANAANQTAYPNICGCFIPPVFDNTIPASMQQIITANPKCFNANCTNSFQLSSWGVCDINILNCINTQNVNLSNGSQAQQVSLKDTTACQQTVGTTGGVTTTTTPTTTTTDLLSNLENGLTSIETFIQTEWLYSSIVLGLLLLFLIYLMYTVLFTQSTDEQILSLLNDKNKPQQQAALSLSTSTASRPNTSLR